MKNLKNFLTESNRGWELDGPIKPNSKFIGINTDGETYSFYSEQEIKSWGDDFDMSEEEIEELLNLKLGEYWSIDGINHYIRISK